MKYKVLVENNADDLVEAVNKLLEDKWEVIGSHSVALRRTQNRFSGERHMDSLNQLEYSQTMIKGE